MTTGGPGGAEMGTLTKLALTPDLFVFTGKGLFTSNAVRGRGGWMKCYTRAMS